MGIVGRLAYFLVIFLGIVQLWAIPVYWTDRTNGLVIRSDENGSSPTTIVSGLTGPRQLAYDSVNFKIYLNDTTSIKRFNIDGTGLETLATLNVGYGVAVVPETGTFYYSGRDAGGTGIIYSHPISGGSSASIVSQGSRIFHDLSVDTVNNVIYFASEDPGGFDAIRQVNTDGSGLSTYFGSMQAARGTDVDSVNGHLYYTGSSSTQGRLKRGDVGGGGETVLITTSTSDPPEGVSVDVANNYIFYTQDGNNTINRSSLTGSGSVQIGSVAGDTHGVLVIPEPSTWGLIASIAAFGLVLARRNLGRSKRCQKSA